MAEIFHSGADMVEGWKFYFAVREKNANFAPALLLACLTAAV